MDKQTIKGLTLGEIVTSDFRAASIFTRAGLDFCCGGNKNMKDACEEKSIDPDVIAEEIIDLVKSGRPKGHRFNEWTPSFLADYIVNTHHLYLRKTLPELVFYTDKIARVHKEKHPELEIVSELFAEINNDLLQHLKKEEELLFPAIKSIYEKNNERDKPLIRALMRKMSLEHESAGAATDKIRELTGGYLIPGDGCNTYALTMKMLKEFEDDLHFHVHLENNILYPAAMKLTAQENEKIKIG